MNSKVYCSGNRPFTVAYLVACPLNENEAGGDLVSMETSLLFLCNDAVLMLISSKFHKRSSEVSIKTRSPPASFSFKGQVTKHTTVKINGLLHEEVLLSDSQ